MNKTIRKISYRNILEVYIKLKAVYLPNTLILKLAVLC